MIALDLPTDIENRLEAQAKRTGRTITDCVRVAIDEFLGEAEYDTKAYQRAVQAMSDIQSGKEKTYPLEEVMKEFGVDDVYRQSK